MSIDELSQKQLSLSHRHELMIARRIQGTGRQIGNGNCRCLSFTHLMRSNWDYDQRLPQIVNKAWNFAHVLRDDGLS